MATVTPDFYNDTGSFEAAQIVSARRADFVIDFANLPYEASDDIKIARLPGGMVILAATIQNVVAGNGTGELTLRSGSTAITGALVNNATAGTVAANLAASTPRIVPASGEDLNILADSGAVRTSGVVRVVLIVAEGDRYPRQPVAAIRDAIAGTS